MDATDFGLLGPLTVTVDGRLVHVSAARQRVVLGVLLVQANHVVNGACSFVVGAGDGHRTRVASLEDFES